VAYRKIVVGVDGSSCGEHARAVATVVAIALEARLTVVHAYEDRAERSLIDAAVEACEAEGATARGELVKGPASNAVLEFAERKGTELLVLGAWGLVRSQRHPIGSVPYRASHHAPCDVLIAAEHDHDGQNGGRGPHAVIWDHIVIATDGSPTADRACRRGFELAGKLGAKVTLVFVGHPKTGELILNDTVAAIASDVPTELRIERGEPAERILAAAQEVGGRLIIIGNRGMSGAKRLLLGSVPQSVVERTPRDALVVRTVTQNLKEIGRGEGGVVDDAGDKLAVFRDDRGEVHALSAKCTHMGCTVGWNPAEKTWDCPCHGSRFSPAGEVVNGPAKKPLQPIAIEE
jgi:nucleotide-binding universal stress UspA family protein/nitrite reductase/ring-hydroxylating ferredoxin subunit